MAKMDTFTQGAGAQAPESVQGSNYEPSPFGKDPWSTLDLRPMFSVEDSQRHRYGQEDAAIQLARAREDQSAWEAAAKQRSGIGLRRTIQGSSRTMGPRQRQIREFGEVDQARMAEERRQHQRAIQDAEVQQRRAAEAPSASELQLPSASSFINPGDVDGFVGSLFSQLGLQLPFGFGG